MTRASVAGLSGALLIMLTGCESPTLIMTTEGPSSQIPHSSDNQYHGQYAILTTVFTKAQTQALADTQNPSGSAQANAAIYAELAKDGMATVDDNCSDFFTTAGEHEKYIDFARDAVAFTGTLASGVLALTDASNGAVAAVTLGTTTVYGGLDVYTKNFLFGAENIDSVRTLIENALDAHTKKVLADPQPVWTFNNAMRVILDHQEICRPSAIVSLVREAIRNAQLVAAATGAPTTPQNGGTETPAGGGTTGSAGAGGDTVPPAAGKVANPQTGNVAPPSSTMHYTVSVVR
ncbi:MAG: hypothetical protein JO208_05515 [Alphaproteobacteria bacterium]|nr:hypothetical protein [Alphaproteobacteria bacterium]